MHLHLRIGTEWVDIFEGYLHASEKGLKGLEKRDVQLLNEATEEMNDLNQRLERLTERMRSLPTLRL